MQASTITLPHMTDDIFLTDGGLETWMIFEEGIDLPEFAAFDLLKDDAGLAALVRYYRHYIDIARAHDVGFILESPTWRGSIDWAEKIGYDRAALAAANLKAVSILHDIKAEAGFERAMIVSGSIGPRDDGYDPASFMTVIEAECYHAEQISTFAEAEADMISAMTMTYVNEAVGIARAAHKVGLPVVISFTTETDGRLPDGTSLKTAIEATDDATDGDVAYYMVNCAHPSHFEHILQAEEGWAKRIRGVRANASTLSHAELDEAEELDAGDPEDFARRYLDLRNRLPNVTVLGGCCGTDHRHVGAVAHTCLAA